MRSLARREAGRPAGIAPWYRGLPSLPCATRASCTAHPPTPFRTLSSALPTSPRASHFLPALPMDRPRCHPYSITGVVRNRLFDPAQEALLRYLPPRVEGPGRPIAYTLHRTRLHQSATFAALYLLQRLKAWFPAAKGSSGHHLFLSAFMLSSKTICDDMYSNKSSCIVGQGMFALRGVNRMERQMRSYLERQLNVDPSTLRDFQHRVQ